MEAKDAIKILLKHVSPSYWEQELPGGEWRFFRVEVHDGERWRWINGQVRREGDQVHFDDLSWSDALDSAPPTDAGGRLQR